MAGVSKAKQLVYEALIIAVAEGEPVSAFCRRHGLNRSTALKWVADPQFDRRVRAVRQRYLDRAVGRLSKQLTAAADSITDLMLAAVDERVKLAASRSILDKHVSLVEHTDVVSRLEALEQRQAEIAERTQNEKRARTDRAA